MRKALAASGSAVFFVLAPGFVAGLVPWWISRRDANAIAPGRPWTGAGMFLIVAGAWVLVDCFARFALQGLGTPSPVFPTRRLVVTGLYQYVRNPMYVAVLAVILGQSLLWVSGRVLGYGALVWLGFHLFVRIYEEPGLRARYGGEYDEFCTSVPRWIPRLSRWQRS